MVCVVATVDGVSGGEGGESCGGAGSCVQICCHCPVC